MVVVLLLPKTSTTPASDVTPPLPSDIKEIIDKRIEIIENKAGEVKEVLVSPNYSEIFMLVAV